MGSADRAEINQTVDDIDEELLSDPETKGEDYFGDRYVLFPLLWALYRIYPNDLMVHVLQVGRPGFDLPHEQ
ncbi:MAG TPA: hypothetical protein VLM40_08910 [Gemmata sp.]|nr:hypothetical protein [Gemmata sp.]